MSEKINPSTEYVTDDEGNLIHCDECSEPMEREEFDNLPLAQQVTFTDAALCPQCKQNLDDEDDEDDELADEESEE